VPQPICPPDLSGRPFGLVVERSFPVPPPVLFDAWTVDFDRWFAEPGAIALRPEVDSPYFFETFHAGRRHPHYGRFLRVDRPRLLKFTWMNEAGTNGHETVLTLTWRAVGTGAVQRLSHRGFPDDTMRGEHESAWRALLEERLSPMLAERSGDTPLVST
jgi:uncharacterized protein YndB with AHSA1/START domain